MNEKEFAELSAGYALGALAPDEEHAFRAALAAHPEWNELVQRDAATAAHLAGGAAPVAPPAAIRDALLRAIAEPAAEPEPAPAPAPAAPAVAGAERRAGWSRRLFTLAASLVLMAGIGWGVASVWNTLQTPAAVVALTEIQQAPDASTAAADFEGGTATVHWSESLGKVVLVADGLPRLDADRTFELWYVRGEQAIAAGTFSADSGRSTAELRGQMQPGDTIAVTVEQAGGSPDGVPTTTPILAVPTA